MSDNGGGGGGGLAQSVIAFLRSKPGAAGVDYVQSSGVTAQDLDLAANWVRAGCSLHTEEGEEGS